MKNKNNSWQPRSVLWWMFLPCAAYYFVFDYIPMSGLMISFKDYNIQKGILGSEWVGMEHFATLFSGDEFGTVLRNTIVISLIKIILGFLAPVIFAILLNELRITFLSRGMQVISLLPHLFSWVILASIFRLIFSTNGPANELVQLVGFEKPIKWLSDDIWFITVIVITDIWKGVGIGAIIYLASISAIPVSLYESAEIDGANRFQKIRFITIPPSPVVICLVG